ncbi:uncharacterized protein [Dermacentor albipictus]|uniref:uncharacterized protein isoform X1 n=1 Tax=Dermacentor albipictus TaxID=60249 RepID=UPI0038FCDCD8
MSVIELPPSAADATPGALVASPPPPPSPPPLLLRALPLCTVGSDTKAGPSKGFPHRMIGGGPSRALAAYQEHAAVLRDHLVAIEDSLDTVPPEDYPQLKKALLEVSKMISQMESLADALAERRLNLKNELRTLQDENVHLHGALVRERRKAHGRDRRGSVTNRGGRKIPPPILPRRDSSFIFNSMRPFMFPPSPPRYQPFSDTDSCVIDLTFETTGSSASTSRVIPSPGPSGTSRRGRGLTRGGRSASHVAGAKRSPSSKRGRGSATRSRPRPSLRTLTGNDSNASSSSPVATSPGFALLAGPPLAMSPISLSPDARSPVGQNDINDLNNRLTNRNNKLAGKKMFSIFDSCPYLN